MPTSNGFVPLDMLLTPGNACTMGAFQSIGQRKDFIMRALAPPNRTAWVTRPSLLRSAASRSTSARVWHHDGLAGKQAGYFRAAAASMAG